MTRTVLELGVATMLPMTAASSSTLSPVIWVLPRTSINAWLKLVIRVTETPSPKKLLPSSLTLTSDLASRRTLPPVAVAVRVEPVTITELWALASRPPMTPPVLFASAFRVMLAAIRAEAASRVTLESDASSRSPLKLAWAPVASLTMSELLCSVSECPTVLPSPSTMNWSLPRMLGRSMPKMFPRSMSLPPAKSMSMVVPA